MLALFLFGCLERVTGEPVPLDERFYKSAESRHGDPNKGDGTSDPFASMDGEKITVSGIVSCGLWDPLIWIFEHRSLR